MSPMQHHGSRLLAWLALLTCPLAALANSLNVTLTDQNGAAVNDAVVYVTTIDGKKPAKAVPRQATVDQIGQMFVPHVRAIGLGSTIRFPNSDNIRHMVYSLSGAKSFELPLYIGKEAPAVLFDNAGLVTLGCNIHDKMLGYILVLDTAHFAEVNDGKASVANVPAGRWTVEIWHPRLEQGKPLQLTVDATGSKDGSLEQKLQLRPERMNQRAPHRGGSHY